MKRFEWLGKQSLDFYLPSKNIAIECQGEQHFRSFEHWGGKEGLEKRQKLDKQKFSLCNSNNVKILYFSKWKVNNYITNKNEILKNCNNENI